MFLISGFWHGANWNFIIWGAWHGLFLILDRLFLIKLFKSIGVLPRILINYLIVLVGWVFFRTETINEAFIYLNRMFAFEFGSINTIANLEFNVTLVLAILFSVAVATKPGKALQDILYAERRTLFGNIVMASLIAFLFLICASYITSTNFNPFIYFRF